MEENPHRKVPARMWTSSCPFLPTCPYSLQYFPWKTSVLSFHVTFCHLGWRSWLLLCCIMSVNWSTFSPTPDPRWAHDPSWAGEDPPTAASADPPPQPLLQATSRCCFCSIAGRIYTSSDIHAEGKRSKKIYKHVLVKVFITKVTKLSKNVFWSSGRWLKVIIN